MEQFTDEDYIARSLNGDNEAFCSLVERHQAMVRAYIASYVYGREEVYDVAQETFLAAHRRLETFQQGTDLGRWLRGIARTTSLMYIRSAGRRRQHEHAAAEFMMEQRVAALEYDTEPDSFEDVRQCMQRLARRHQVAHLLLTRHYMEDVPLTTLAKEMKIGRGALRVRLMRARRHIAECLQAQAVSG